MEALKVEILEETEKHRLEVNKFKAEIATVDTEVRVIKDEVVESTASCDHFRTEIEQSKVKEKLISDQEVTLKNHVEHLEEAVSQKILLKKELKGKKKIADLEANDIEQQFTKLLRMGK